MRTIFLIFLCLAGCHPLHPTHLALRAPVVFYERPTQQHEEAKVGEEKGDLPFLEGPPPQCGKQDIDEVEPQQ